MARATDPRKLIVTLNSDAEASWLEYKPVPADQDDRAPDSEPLCRRVRWPVLGRSLEAVRRKASDLLELARLGRAREQVCLEEATDPLGALVLPETGLAEILSPPGASTDSTPQPWFLPPSQPVVASLPWEAFRENYWYCNRRPSCASFRRPGPVEPGSKPIVCPDCGGPVRVVDGRLGLCRPLAFRPPDGPTGAARGGDRFVIVADPTGTLCAPENDTDGAVARHLETLQRRAADRGYEVVCLHATTATEEAVSAALADPRVAVFYYFGPGPLPGDGHGEGGLALAGGGALRPSRINSSVPFVFLNGCRTDGASDGSELFGGLAVAFARGRGKAVIAPVWPLTGARAAASALEFFRSALKPSASGQGGRPIQHALRVARRLSRRRYDRGEPDLAWASYRYLGHPDRVLPRPRAERAGVFDADGRLDTERFAFDCDEVVFEAAKRCRRHGGSLLSCTDLISGLIGKGALTRSLLASHEVDPDALKRDLADAPETRSPQDADAQSVRIAPGPAAAIEEAARRAGSALVSERRVLDALVESGLWAESAAALEQVGVRLTPAAEICAWLAVIGPDEATDDNGRIRLDGLDARALKVVETAHTLAQQRGVRTIPHRLMLTGFLLADSRGLAVRACARQGVHAESLAALLIASTRGEHPGVFPLSPDVGLPVLLPTLTEARSLAEEEGDAEVGESHLLRAFCRVAAEGFRDNLRSLPQPWRLDLDEVGEAAAKDAGPAETAVDDPELTPDLEAEKATGDRLEGATDAPVVLPGELDASAWDLLRRAQRWARVQGGTVVRSPHLFAALVGQGDGPVGLALRHNRLDPESVKQTCLMLVPSRETRQADEAGAMELSASSCEILRGAVDFARRHGRSRASNDDLLRAFFHEGGGIVGQLLAEQGVDLQTWINIYAADPDAPDGAALGETDQPRPGPEESADDDLAGHGDEEDEP